MANDFFKLGNRNGWLLRCRVSCLLEPGQSQLVVWEGLTIEGDVDDIVLRDAAGDAVACGVRDESLPNPGP